MSYRQRLELDWIGKDDELALEPRILIHNENYGSVQGLDNMLIHGDNLLALKALESDFANKIKCIYIDPPYNTKQAFDHYDDNLEHSKWLSMMKPRLELLKGLLTEDGIIFVQINDDEMAYLKVLMDEIFGRTNFINQISVKTKHTSGASGGGEDKKLKKNVEYILIYAKSNESTNGFKKFNPVYEEEDLFDLIQDMEDDGKSWKYTSVLIDKGTVIDERIVLDGSGNDIRVKKYKGITRTTISKLTKDGECKDMKDAYSKHFNWVFSDTNAQTSIRTRIIDEFNCLENDELLEASYVPKSGKDKGQEATHYYISPSVRRMIMLKDTAQKKGSKIIKLEKLGTFWEGFNWNNVSKEGDVVFPNGKKPEALIQRILELATEPGDFILDSFAGSGTTGATAHKMGRKWIMVEMGSHCSSHIIPRMTKVLNGEDSGGITENVKWPGGGGFKFFELAPSLLQKDTRGNWIINDQYDSLQLAEAVCKHEKFKFFPHESLYWKQGFSSEKDFIFVTTQFLTSEHLDYINTQLLKDETLLICAKAFRITKNKYPNITLKKIPQMLLGRCEFGRDDYSLNTEEAVQEELDINSDV